LYQHRSKYEEIYEILNQLNNENCQTSQLLSCTNKSLTTFDELMKALVSQGFLLESDGNNGTQYQITEEGKQFYEILSTIYSLVDVQTSFM
jgi:predicted transcriptional regulator